MWRKAIETQLERHHMLRFGRRIGIAVSGGADSVFLLRALADFGLATLVLHVNHQLRGSDSDADEAFVRALGFPVHAATLPVPDGNTEQEARRLRYAFFTRALEEGLCDAVATGHTLDDQAETVLARFLRGSGTAGLRGVLPVTEARVIRPILTLRRADIRAFLASRNIAWQEDCTNSDAGYLRNRIRLITMPQLEPLNPSLAPVLASTAEWARDEEEYWSAEIATLEIRLALRDREAVLFSATRLRELPRAACRRLIRRGIEQVKGSLLAIGFQHVDAVLDMLATRHGSGRIQLPGVDVYRSFDWLRLAPPGFDTRLERDFEVPLMLPGITEIPSRRLRIAVKPMERELVSGARVYNNQMNGLDGERCSGALTLRNWRPGDSLTAFEKSPGVLQKVRTEKIKTLFQQHRVPLWERRNWPVIANGDAILWTRRFGAAAEFAAGPHSKTAFVVEESGESIRTLATSNHMDNDTCSEMNEVM